MAYVKHITNATQKSFAEPPPASHKDQELIVMKRTHTLRVHRMLAHGIIVANTLQNNTQHAPRNWLRRLLQAQRTRIKVLHRVGTDALFLRAVVLPEFLLLATREPPEGGVVLRVSSRHFGADSTCVLPKKRKSTSPRCEPPRKSLRVNIHKSLVEMCALSVALRVSSSRHS